MKRYLPTRLFIIVILFSPLSWAEIYKWTDESGKVHYSDRPPASAKASNISDQLDNINITRDLSSPEMMLDAKQREENQRKEANREAKQQRKNDKARREFCQEAKARLWQLQGPVVFFDKDGKEMKVTEKEREKKEQALLKEIDKKCK